MSIVLVSLLLTLSRCFPIDKAIGKKWSQSNNQRCTHYTVWNLFKVDNKDTQTTSSASFDVFFC